MNARTSRAAATASAPVRALLAEELALLAFLAPHEEGLGIRELHAHNPAALVVVDRLVAKGHVARYPGCIFGVTTIGRTRLLQA